MTRQPRLLPTLLGLLAALALGLPATSLAGEGATTTTTAATPPEATSATPAPETETTPTTTTTSGAPSSEPAPATETATAPTVEGQSAQGTSGSGNGHAQSGSSHGSSEKTAASGGEQAPSSEGPRAKQKAVAPSALTPSLPGALQSGFGTIPGFFIESFEIPPFLLPIFQAAGTAYGVPWQVLAAINEVETDYGRDLSVSSAGAEGWMQFLPSEWAQYGVDANGDGYEDPYNPADAIFAAARYLRAAGGANNIRAAVYSYNHSSEYVESVMLRAQLLGGTPADLLGAVTGLTEARFPVHAAAHFGDGFQSVTTTSAGRSSTQTLVGTTIYAQLGAPVIAVQDGEVVQVGESPALGHFIALRDAFGNTYVYGQLGEVASVYPVLEPKPHTRAAGHQAASSPKPEPAPSGPATAGAQTSAPLSAGATISALALGAAAPLESAPPSPAPTPPTNVPAPAPRPSSSRVFSEGSDDVFLHTLRPGVQVIAGTVLGHVGSGAVGGQTNVQGEPHMLFQIRPAGAGAPLIDPKPILDGWVALGNTSIFRAKGENPFQASPPTIGQVLLESKQQLEPQVLGDAGIHLDECGRQDVQSGRVDERVLATLEYLSVSGLHPTVAGLPCAGASVSALGAPVGASSEAVEITAVNGVPVAGHQGRGSVADETVRRLLGLQGLARPQQIASLMSYPGESAAIRRASAADAIDVAFAPPGQDDARAATADSSGLSPNEWIDLVARLGEIPDPTVARGPSAAAIADHGETATGPSGEDGGDN